MTKTNKIAILNRGQIERGSIGHTIQHSYSCRTALLDNIVKPLKDTGYDVDHYCTGYVNDTDHNTNLTTSREEYFSFYRDDRLKLRKLNEFINIYDENRQPRQMTGIYEPNGHNMQHSCDYIVTDSGPKFFKTHQQLHQESVFLHSIAIDFNWVAYDYLIVARSDILYTPHKFWSNFQTRDADIVVPFPEQNKNLDRFCDTLHIIKNPAEICNKIYDCGYSRPNPPQFSEPYGVITHMHKLLIPCIESGLKIDYITGHAQCSGSVNTSFYKFPSMCMKKYHGPAITEDNVCDSILGTTEKELNIINLNVHLL